MNHMRLRPMKDVTDPKGWSPTKSLKEIIVTVYRFAASCRDWKDLTGEES